MDSSSLQQLREENEALRQEVKNLRQQLQDREAAETRLAALEHARQSLNEWSAQSMESYAERRRVALENYRLQYERDHAGEQQVWQYDGNVSDEDVIDGRFPPTSATHIKILGN